MKIVYSILFIVISACSLFAQKIETAEYFWDSDPGHGNAIKIDIENSDTLEFRFSPSISGLSVGMHNLFIRFRDSNNLWSPVKTMPVFVDEVKTDPKAAELEYAEYFWDQDPGFGNGSAIAFNPDDTLTFDFSIDIDKLGSEFTKGMHQLFIRYRNTAKNWSPVKTVQVFVTREKPDIIALEYYLSDSVSTIKTIPFTPSADTIELSLSIPVYERADGEYEVNLYVRDAILRTSTPELIPFQVQDTNKIKPVVSWPVTSNLVYGDILALTELLNGDANVPGHFVFSYPDSILSVGTHSVSIQFIPDNSTDYAIQSQIVSLVVTAVDAKLTASVTSGYAPLQVDFSIITNGDRYAWDFNNDGITDSYEKNPSCVYSSEGNYIVTVKVFNGTTVKTFQLNQAVKVSAPVLSNCSDLIISETITNVACPGDATGKIVLDVSGGKAPYVYLWSNTRTDNMIANMRAGIYSVVVVDQNGCEVTKTYTITQPAAIVIDAVLNDASCNSNDGQIEISVSGGSLPYSYKWNTGSVSQNLSGLETGAYILTVTDNKGCIAKKYLSLKESGAPEIVFTNISESSCKNDGYILVSVENAGKKYTYSWNDGAKTLNRVKLEPGEYTLVVTDELSACSSSATALINSTLPQLQPISVVTVSEETGKNLIVWERVQPKDEIDFYTIYRETYEAGVFDPIATVQSDDITVYRDDEADPIIRSWRYKISATDNCGNESELSSEHKTIHATPSLGLGGTIHLRWDNYEGIRVSTYGIYRKNSNSSVERLTSLPANLLSFTDANPTANVQGYFVAVDLKSVIDTSALKSDSGPFSQSMSNICESEISGLENLQCNNVIVFPNPADDYIQLSGCDDLLNTKSVSIIMTDGKELPCLFIVNNEILKVELPDIVSGTYVIKTLSNTGMIVFTFSKKY